MIQAECSLVKHLGEQCEEKLQALFDVEEAGAILSFTLPRTLAQLLRANLVAECYVPSREDREKRGLIREWASMTKIRTELRNKIHDLLAKYEYSHGFSDLFGKEGMEWLKAFKLSQYDQTILDANLRLLESLDAEIEKLSVEIARLAIDHMDKNRQDQVKLLLGSKGIAGVKI
jgi:hypothetical protein